MEPPQFNAQYLGWREAFVARDVLGHEGPSLLRLTLRKTVGAKPRRHWLVCGDSSLTEWFKYHVPADGPDAVPGTAYDRIVIDLEWVERTGHQSAFGYAALLVPGGRMLVCHEHSPVEIGAPRQVPEALRQAQERSTLRAAVIAKSASATVWLAYPA